MIEHRLIEKMMLVIKQLLQKIENSRTVNPLVVDTIIDFMRMYADRTHHGKEEDILFKELSKRPLTAQDQCMMNELIQEHIGGRQLTSKLAEANSRYTNGDVSALEDIVFHLGQLVAFYSEHIEREERIFLPASRTYFTEEEDHSLLSQFWEFDRKMIHEKYRQVVKELEIHEPDVSSRHL
jgi:hemerythrin-like domain-containing protein